MPKNELGDVHLFRRVHRHGDAFPVVVDGDQQTRQRCCRCPGGGLFPGGRGGWLEGDGDVDGRHLLVALFVIRGVDKDLVEDLE
jgi:hypothetical protein